MKIVRLGCCHTCDETHQVSKHHAHTNKSIKHTLLTTYSPVVHNELTRHISQAINEIIPSLKYKIQRRGGYLVMRPDSGDPVEVCVGSIVCR